MASWETTEAASATIYTHMPTGLQIALSLDSGELTGRVLNIEATEIRDARLLATLLREAASLQLDSMASWH